MRTLTKILAGGAFVAALASAAPASAQYYPGYGYPGYGGGGNVVGQVLNQVLGGGYGSYNNYGGYGGYGAYGGNQQAAVSQCAAAVQQRLGGGYSPYGGYGGGYGYNGGGGRVLGISRVEPRSGGGVTVRGVASTGGYGGYGYNGQGQANLTFKCKADYRGFVTSVSFDRTNIGSGYGYSPYDYSQYGYRRY